MGYAARMADVEVTPTTLVVHIRGADQFFALKSRLEVPLEHIAGIDVRPDEHDAKLVVGVDDPDATAQAITAAISGR